MVIKGGQLLSYGDYHTSCTDGLKYLDENRNCQFSITITWNKHVSTFGGQRLNLRLCLNLCYVD